MRKFCFVCGKKTEELIEGYCEECYSKETKLIEIPKKFEIIVCSKCDLMKFRNRWIEGIPEDIIRKKVKVLGDDVKIKIKRNDTYQIIAKGYPENSKKLKKEVYDLNVHLNKIVCSICAKRLSGYYEAIIQLRDIDLFDYVDEEIRKMNDKSAFYRVEEVRGGLNIYIGSKGAANKVASLLRKKGYKIKKTFKLVTKKLGKNVYRTIISVK